MYLLVEVYHLQQRTLALYVVVVRRCRWGHKEHMHFTSLLLLCQCCYNVLLQTNEYEGVRTLCTCMVLRCRWGHKDYCAVLHKDKGVDERYGDAALSYGGVDLSGELSVAPGTLDPWASFEAKDNEVTWCDACPLIGQAAESWSKWCTCTCCIPRTKKQHLQAS